MKIFNFKHFKSDLFGGVTAGIVALPLALAFGVSSGLGPSAGLYGAILVSFFAALFGGTNTQISGPTAPMTAVSMVVIAGILANFEGDINKALPSILTVFLLAGLMQVVLGLLGIGKYIKYIPYPVVSGFMTAIGVIILVTQIMPSVGYYPKEDTAFVEQFKPEAEEVILENILKDEAAEGILVLEDFEESSFIASPVLKRLQGGRLPAVEWAGPLIRGWDKNQAQTYFAYSGNWLADLESPPGLSKHFAYLSSNQQGYNASSSVGLDIDDFIFLRPTQSEAVLLEFGDLIGVRGNVIEQRWPVLPAGV